MILLNGNRHEPAGNSMELILELERVQREFSRGILTKEAALASLKALQETTFRRHIRPCHARGLRAALVGAVLLALWVNVEYVFLDLADGVGQWMEVLPVLGIASLVIAAVHLSIYFKRIDENVRYFHDLRIAIEMDGGN